MDGYIFSYNIGYVNGVLNLTPFIITFKTIREFTDMVRNSKFQLSDWSRKNGIPNHSLCIYLKIYRTSKDEDGEWEWENEFKIMCRNIREFKPLVKMSDAEIDALQRDSKLEDILNG